MAGIFRASRAEIRRSISPWATSADQRIRDKAEHRGKRAACGNGRKMHSVFPVMAGPSRPKDGVASARLCPAMTVLRDAVLSGTWMPGTRPKHDGRETAPSKHGLR